MRFVHDRIFPVVCHLSRLEDSELLLSANYLHGSDFSADQLGLPEDFCVPLAAAVVEMASLDMRTTPLDRLTCFYDAAEQVRTHIREAVLAARADSEDAASEREELNKLLNTFLNNFEKSQKTLKHLIS